MDSAKFFMHIGLAMLSGLGGLFHIVYCCLFFTSGVGVWNAAILVFTAVYGLMLWRPGPKFLVYSHLLLLLSGSVVLILTAIGIHCSRRLCSVETWSRPMQEQCLHKFVHNPALLQGMARIHTAIHSLLVLESVLQIILALSVCVKYFFAFIDAIKDHFNWFFLQATLGLLAFVLGCLQTLFCSHFYFLAVGVWASAGVFLSALCHNCRLQPKDRSEDKAATSLSRSASKATRPSNYIVARISVEKVLRGVAIGCGASLVLYGAVGAYCGQPVSLADDAEIEELLATTNDTVRPKCDRLVSPSIYHSCYGSLESIGFWHRDHDHGLLGLAKVQQALTAMLLACGGATLAINGLVWYRKRQKARREPPPPVVV